MSRLYAVETSFLETPLETPKQTPKQTPRKALEATPEKIQRQILRKTLALLAGSLAIGVGSAGQVIAQTITPATTASAVPVIDQLNIFGDSLSDAGNVFTLSNGLFPPSPPYAQRLSNGPVWVETIGAELGLSPALAATAVPPVVAGIAPPPADGINYALAGSLSSDVNVGGALLPGLQQQVATFSALAKAGAGPSDNALHILLAGGNDYNEAILSPTPLDISDLVDEVTDNILGATAALFSAGAKNVLVSNLPTLGLQPFADSVNEFNPQGANILSALSSEHNQQLAQKLTALTGALAPSGATLTQFDLSSITDKIIGDPNAFGFDNAEDSCLTNFQIDGTFEGVCADPDKFFFWDDVHPTAAGHAAIAQSALQTLGLTGNDLDNGLDDSFDNNINIDGVGNEATTRVPEPASLLALLTLGGVLSISKRKSNLAKQDLD